MMYVHVQPFSPGAHTPPPNEQGTPLQQSEFVAHDCP
jgi:hypothetical protein